MKRSKLSDTTLKFRRKSTINTSLKMKMVKYKITIKIVEIIKMINFMDIKKLGTFA
jgi:hypothetical protein